MLLLVQTDLAVAVVAAAVVVVLVVVAGAEEAAVVLVIEEAVVVVVVDVEEAPIEVASETSRGRKRLSLRGNVAAQ